MQFGLDVPTTGEYAHPRILADLAAEAEDAGCDGIFVWDVLLAADGATDTWVALAAIAMKTERLRIGTMVTPLARRRPWLVAREDERRRGRLGTSHSPPRHRESCYSAGFSPIRCAISSAAA